MKSLNELLEEYGVWVRIEAQNVAKTASTPSASKVEHMRNTHIATLAILDVVVQFKDNYDVTISATSNARERIKVLQEILGYS